MFQVIVSRNYRGDVDMSCIEKFMPLLVEKEDEGLASPIIQVAVFYYLKIWLRGHLHEMQDPVRNSFHFFDR